MTRLLIMLTAAALILAISVVRPAEAAHSDRGCNRCHVPHNAGDPNDPTGTKAYGVPLWSNYGFQDGDIPVYELYTSHTLDATLSQPDGAARLCLGCHDGTGKTNMNPDRAFTATELTQSHPVSFVYDSALAAADGNLKDPAVALSGLGGTISADLLDIRGKMQCTSCHDVHTSAAGPSYLRYEWDPLVRNDHLLCRTCHNK